MVVRFIAFLAAFGIFIAFIGLNLENTSDVSFGFTVLKRVPVFMTVFVSFALGFLVALPFVVRGRLLRRDKTDRALVKKGRKTMDDGTYGVD
jgi:hypothetical protein